MVSLGEITSYFTLANFFLILIFGTIGNLFNLLTLLSKDFRKNSCIFYMICSSLLDLFFINFGILIRLSTEYFGNPSSTTSRCICKVRSYFLVCLPAMASTCIFLSTFARRLFFITMSFLSISSLFHLFIFDIHNNRCTTTTKFDTILVIVYPLTFISLVPHLGMFICGIVTWIHTRQSKARIEPSSISTQQSSSNQRTNRQLFLLIFVHAALCVLLEIQRSTSYVYNLVTSSTMKSVQQQQIESFVIQLSVVFYYAKYAMSFYVNYACSTMFRQTFTKSIESILSRCFQSNS
ncbi:unnamed protein product [Adineta ricciae]|uniref:G-protein coupled receptors family 1 profile domain-containing protein n=1 Tax=Adineta ricciae TaxID=249248 RepID=A0A816C593_ADIRI|nr:unnamed protein product [Adineta ricciae]CAF1618465.1 unnamed protein product [Adineta ricciae]